MIGDDDFSVSVQEALLDSFRRHADRIAVDDPITRLSYADLGDISTGVAERILDRMGDTPGRIALAFGQNARYLIALVAVLRSGKTCVPLDPRRGLAWNRDIVARTGCATALCDDEHAEFAKDLGIPAETVAATSQAKGDTGLVVSMPPGDIACIYSTSGTTGPPKAVCDTHRNLLHNAARYATTLSITPNDRLSLIQAPIFSGTQSTIFMGLTRGAALCCLDVANGKLGELPSWLAQSEATVFHSVPSIFRTLERDGPAYHNIRLVRLEGDQPTDKDVRVLRENFSKECRLVVGLGATECGLIRQHFIDFDSDVLPGPLPMGRAVRDMDVSIRDQAGNHVPAGTKGEVWVTSRFLAEGYLDDAQRTRDRFPISSDGTRSYRTGDLGCLGEDGVLWLHGRNDRQVKFRGESVDLGEVEAALAMLPFVAQACVSASKDSQGEVLLMAHLVGADGEKRSLESVRTAMASMLPEHFLPSRVAWLDQLPLTRDGKLDRMALPTEFSRPEMDTLFVAPRTEMERVIADIWQDVLGISPVGVFDDLFSLGVDSLSIVRFADIARRRLRMRIRLASIFETPTVARLAETIVTGPESRQL